MSQRRQQQGTQLVTEMCLGQNEPRAVMTDEDSLSEHVCEEPVGPLACVGVQRAVQVVFADSFGVDDVSDALHALQPLQGFEQDSPGHGFPAARRTDHHQPVIDLRDLIELQHLRKKSKPLQTHDSLREHVSHHDYLELYDAENTDGI